MENMKKVKKVAVPALALAAGFTAIVGGAVTFVKAMEKFVIAFIAVTNDNGYKEE